MKAHTGAPVTRIGPRVLEVQARSPYTPRMVARGRNTPVLRRSRARRRARRRARTAAYTLIELMIVVAITGVLAALAIPAFNSYVQKGRASEAVTFLGVVKVQREEKPVRV